MRPKTTKKLSELTLHDLLSRLGYAAACKLLDADGAALLRAGGQFELELEQIELSADSMRAHVHESVVQIVRTDVARGRLGITCSTCRGPCVHAGALLSFVLEEKLALGLSAVPEPRVPIESLSEEELTARALEERKERARAEKMRLVATDPQKPWTDYKLTSVSSGKSYRVALRGTERGVSYCSCPDFRKNTLGTCKHIIYALERVRRRFSAAELATPYRRSEFSIYLRYGAEVTLHCASPDRLDPETRSRVGPLLSGPITDLPELLRRIRQLHRAGHEVKVYPDAEVFIEQALMRERLESRAREIRANPTEHPLRTSLLKTELLPYQLDGIAFAVGAGRAILADDMGLGKTIQGVGVAELLAREAGIRHVLVICPTSLKAQWRQEIERFSSRTAQLVMGSAKERSHCYGNGTFFTICNYEQVLRDLLAIEQTKWDLIILDEGQRIKNWEAKTSRVIKGLRSRFALVLSGTPLENRLDDLYSVVEFVDDRRLGPAFRFLNQHRVVDERGRVLGYKNLSEVRSRLAGVMLRRTRGDVLKELPSRHVEMLRVVPTEEQLELHSTHMQIVSSIIRKSYFTEMDLLRLQKALLMCRMVADSTALVDKKKPGYSSKLEELEGLLDRLGAEEGRKVVLFSEWTSMLELIEPLLSARGLGYVRLDGSVPQKKRPELVHRFERDPDCTFFITTNAGSTGLNLQVADTLINVDLPWNPAVLEQRIARVHRMGQKRPVQVFVLLTEGTIEERLLTTLSGKHELALAALDAESEVDEVMLTSGIEELRNRLEVLLGAKPEAPLDTSASVEVEREAARLRRREHVAEAAGKMVAGALELLGALVPASSEDAHTSALERDIGATLAECVDIDENGRAKLTIALPSAGTGEAAHLDSLVVLARSLARLASAQTAHSSPLP